jgi:hypothetical protein
MIHKGVLELDGHLQQRSLPRHAKILKFDNQNENPVFWLMFDELELGVEIREFVLVGTGHPINIDGEIEYLGTAQFVEGHLILHLFEVKR